jgi:hypothetical protein
MLKMEIFRLRTTNGDKKLGTIIIFLKKIRNQGVRIKIQALDYPKKQRFYFGPFTSSTIQRSYDKKDKKRKGMR